MEPEGSLLGPQQSLDLNPVVYVSLLTGCLLLLLLHPTRAAMKLLNVITRDLFREIENNKAGHGSRAV
jgi:hypothetical protein